MEVTLKLKHLIIPLIVIIITFIGLIFELENTINNTTLDMTFIYSGSELTIDSEEKFIWSSLNEIQNSYALEDKTTSYNAISLDYLNVNTISESQLESLSYKNEIVVIFGDHYNTEIESILQKNSDTNFILIDNTADITEENVININLDKEQEITTSAKKLAANSKTKQLIYVSSIPMDDNMDNYNLFIENSQGCNVAYYYVPNVNDSTAILTALAEYFYLGYDGVYVEDASVYDLVVTAAKDAQVSIIEETLALEESQTPTSEEALTDTTTDGEVEVETTTTEEPTSETDATTEEDPTAVAEEEVSETEEEIVDLYKQDTIHVVGNYFDNYIDGVYEDTNLDLTYDYLDKSVVLETYTYDLVTTLTTIIDQILSGDIKKNSYTLEPIPVSSVRPVEEVIPIEVPIEDVASGESTTNEENTGGETNE